MIIIKIHGGLGNQMFQYALGRHLSLRNNVDFKLDLSFYERIRGKDTPRKFQLSLFKAHFTICTEEEVNQMVGGTETLREWNKWANRLNINLLPNYFYEKTYHFDDNIFQLADNVYLEGYWQTPQYFAAIEDVIRQDFIFKEAILVQNKDLKQQIESTKSVAIHIRRGDYLTNSMHNVFKMDYIIKATQLMLEKLGRNIQLFIFSDDLDWCKKHLGIINPQLKKHYCNGGSTKEDLHLMSLCKHFIIANSSFSWWAAWLSVNKNKIVIAPKKWFDNNKKDTCDLLPNSWIQI